MADSFRFDESNMRNGILIFGNKFQKAVLMFGITQAQELEDYMKENRKWTDRTNLARQSLTAKCSQEGTGVKITLSHGVDYGLWLELVHEKKYAIVEPTVRLKGAEVFAHFEMLMNKMGMTKV